ncbi:transposase [Tenacibaculum ovolyticum]|uniref:transposase n=1 Tax=Tenacibaculum ovolyticum TaxID=104270 RepID=UPI003BAACBAD
MDKFKNKYRISSTRLQNWDYGSNGAYFITICTKNREHYFGKIKNKEMQLTEVGKLAETYWMEIPEHFPFVTLGNFVIMPNHMHGILIIDKPTLQVKTLQCNVSTMQENNSTTNDKVKTLQCNVSTIQDNSSTTQDKVKTLQCNVSTMHDNSSTKNQQMSKISPKAGSISTIIRSYKSVVTKNARKINSAFGWQSLFHDHIIRNSKAFDTIQNYIANNPEKWDEDTFSE